jgi:hypothetical protein
LERHLLRLLVPQPFSSQEETLIGIHFKPADQGPVHIKSMMFSQGMLIVKINAPDFSKVDLFRLMTMIQLMQK